MRSNNLASWLGQMLLGFALLLVGFEFARTAWGSWVFTAAGASVSLLGLALMAWTEIRQRPQRILRKARRALTFPTQWAVKFNKTVPHGGVIPVAVIRSDGVRFVIDIQSHTHVEWNQRKIGEPLLVKTLGKTFKTDPVVPLMHAATAWAATAILWLPEARTPRNLRQDGCNLIVVMGGARELMHVLRGAEIVQRHDTAVLEMTMPPKPARNVSKTPPVSSPEPA